MKSLNEYLHINEGEYKTYPTKDPISGKVIPMRAVGEFMHSSDIEDVNYTIDLRSGDISIRNSAKKLDSTETPTYFMKNGTNIWYKNDIIHRTDGPAKEYADGGIEYWVEGQLEREDGPAIDTKTNKSWAGGEKAPDGFRYFRTHGPARILNNKEFFFYLGSKYFTSGVSVVKLLPKNTKPDMWFEKNFWDKTPAPKKEVSKNELIRASKKTKEIVYSFISKDGTTINFTPDNSEREGTILFNKE